MPLKVLPPFLGSTGRQLVPTLGLQANLVSCWEFENTSWLDAAGGNTLTGNGTPTPTSANTAPAKVGNYLGLVAANSQYLERAHSDANLDVNGVDFSIAVWAYVTLGSGATILVKADGFGNGEYNLTVAFTSGFRFLWQPVTNGGATGVDIFADNFGNLSTNTWYLVCCTWTHATKTGTVSVNAGARNSVTGSFDISGSTSKFRVGADNSGDFLTGRMDQLCLWRNRVISPSDEVLLYAGSAGLTYAAMA